MSPSTNLPASLVSYADDCDSYAEAVERARRAGYLLGKYADPTEGERLDLSDEDAAELMCEDISIVFVYDPRA